MRPPISSVAAIVLIGGLSLNIGCSKNSESPPTPSGPDRAAGRVPQWNSRIQLAALRNMDSNQLKQIGIAFHNYASQNQDRLPAAIFDSQGKPLLSWRVALLPELEQGHLFAQFRLNEPWDSEHNRKLIPKMPKVYLLPSSGSAEDGFSHYRIFASVPSEVKNYGALFDWTDPKRPGPPAAPRMGNIVDGSSNTILVVEAEEAVIWTKPDEMLYHPSQPIPRVGMFWQDRTHVLMADGSVHTIGMKTSEQSWRRAIQRQDGEVLGPDW